MDVNLHIKTKQHGSLMLKLLALVVTILILASCGSSDPDPVFQIPENVDVSIIESTFSDNLSLGNLHDYEGQNVPNYINEDNTGNNQIRNEVVVLGRVLFYDKNLSSDGSISCASCHQQTNAFGDQDQLSQGVNGLTGRHSMRLINARFADEERFFWDERAETLEEQTTMPVQDHIEMGFSGQDGDQNMDDLVIRLGEIDYMVELFELAFGSDEVTETKMQLALAQFVRSIQSFDSPYDEGRARVNDRRDDFPNFTQEENLGKALFMGRAGCDRCHQGDEFDIDDNSENNAVITVAGDPSGIDTDVTRAPTLRDLFDNNGQLNGPLMHDGSFGTLEEVIAHYNEIELDPLNNNLDQRLRGGDRNNNGDGENLNLSSEEMTAIVAFVKTLSGRNVYVDEKWSDPFN